MSIIFRQSLKSSIYSYLGAIIGFISVGIIMPSILSKEEIGIRMQIQSYAFLFSSILAFGLPQTIIRMFPYFENEQNKNHGILGLLGVISTISTVLFILVFYFFADFFFKLDIKNSILFSQYYPLIIPYTIATLLFITLDGYSSAVKESTIGIFLKDLVLRIGILVALLTFWIVQGFNFNALINSITLLQFIPPFLLVFFLSKKKLFPFTLKYSFPSNKIKNDFFSVTSYNTINVISSVAIITIDSIMLSKFGGSADVGIYTTVNFFVSLMGVPSKGMAKISNSVVASLFKNNEMDTITKIYNSTTLNLMAISIFLLGNMLILIPFIFKVILKGFDDGIGVMVFIGLTYLFKMSTGIKFIIIANSRYYRLNSLLLVIYIVLLIITNWLLIPKYGLNGAAIASFISTILYQIIGIYIVNSRFKLFPFTSTYLKVFTIFLFLGAFIHFLPFPMKSEINALIKACLFSISAILAILKSGFIPEFNKKLKEILP